MQFTSINYPVFIYTTLSLLIFGVLYAVAIRMMDKAGVEGQTAYTVVVGVGVTVIASIGLIGWMNVLYVLICFAASGLPMVIEYVSRTHKAQKHDRQSAKSIAKDLLG